MGVEDRQKNGMKVERPHRKRLSKFEQVNKLTRKTKVGIRLKSAKYGDEKKTDARFSLF